MVQKLICIWIFLFAIVKLNSQEIATLIWEYPSKSFSIKGGLSQGQIHLVFEDSRGFTWICNKEGVDLSLIHISEPTRPY